MAPAWFRRQSASRGAPRPPDDHHLVLYKFDACPYCQRVLRALDRLGLVVELRDTLADPEARRELLEATGRTQVPCLFIDGEPLFESRDIVRWLERHYPPDGSR